MHDRQVLVSTLFPSAAIFTEMTRAPYYHLMRSEHENLSTNGAAMLEAAGVCGGDADGERPVNIMELGAGDGTKTKTLLKALQDTVGDDAAGAPPVTYVPIDISWGAMRALYKVVADVTGGPRPVHVHGYISDSFVALDALKAAGWTHGSCDGANGLVPGAKKPHNVVIYLGSSIGNVLRTEMISFFAAIRARLNVGDHLLLGYDLRRTPDAHLATYPADQTLGALHNASLNRLRRELDADIGTGALAVEVTFDENDGAVNGWLVSTCDHVLTIGRGARRRAFPMKAGHKLRVLLAHKYTLDGMAASAAEGGFEIQKTWTDASGRFADSVFRAV